MPASVHPCPLWLPSNRLAYGGTAIENNIPYYSTNILNQKCFVEAISVLHECA